MRKEGGARSLGHLTDSPPAIVVEDPRLELLLAGVGGKLLLLPLFRIASKPLNALVSVLSSHRILHRRRECGSKIQSREG